MLTLSGSAVGGENVMVCLNETDVVNCTTDGNGWFWFRCHFDVGESMMTYNVQASFEGLNSQTATFIDYQKSQKQIISFFLCCQ